MKVILKRNTKEDKLKTPKWIKELSKNWTILDVNNQQDTIYFLK